MKFKLEIEIGGIVTTAADLATLLDQIAAAYDLLGRDPIRPDSSTVRDGNGKIVGQWAVFP
jgi:hypothetical protein